MYTFLQNKQVLNSNQSGFRPPDFPVFWRHTATQS